LQTGQECPVYRGDRRDIPVPPDPYLCHISTEYNVSDLVKEKGGTTMWAAPFSTVEEYDTGFVPPPPLQETGEATGVEPKEKLVMLWGGIKSH